MADKQSAVESTSGAGASSSSDGSYGEPYVPTSLKQVEDDYGAIILLHWRIAKKRGPFVWERAVSKLEWLSWGMRTLEGMAVTEKDTKLLSYIRDEAARLLSHLYNMQMLYQVDSQRQDAAAELLSANQLLTSAGQVLVDAATTDKEVAGLKDRVSGHKDTLYSYATTSAVLSLSDVERIKNVPPEHSAHGQLSPSTVAHEVRLLQSEAIALTVHLNEKEAECDRFLWQSRRQMLKAITLIEQCPPDVLSDLEHGGNPFGDLPLPTDYRQHFQLLPDDFCRDSFNYLGKECLEKRLLDFDTVLATAQKEKRLNDSGLLKLVKGAYISYMPLLHALKLRKMRLVQTLGKYSMTDFKLLADSVPDADQSEDLARAQILWKHLRQYDFAEKALASLSGIRYFSEVWEPPGGCRAVSCGWQKGGQFVMIYCSDAFHVMHRHLGLSDTEVTERRHAALRCLRKPQAFFYKFHESRVMAPQDEIACLLQDCHAKSPFKDYTVSDSDPQGTFTVAQVFDLGRVIGRAYDGQQTSHVTVVVNKHHFNRRSPCECSRPEGFSPDWFRLITLYPVPPP